MKEHYFNIIININVKITSPGFSSASNMMPSISRLGGVKSLNSEEQMERAPNVLISTYQKNCFFPFSFNISLHTKEGKEENSTLSLCHGMSGTWVGGKIGWTALPLKITTTKFVTYNN